MTFRYFILILLIAVYITAGCAPEKPVPPSEKAVTVALPHLRYFESSKVGNDGLEEFILYDYDLTTLSQNRIWSLSDYNIDRAEITPDGDFVLVHYAIEAELALYFVIYDLNSDDPGQPMKFMRGDTEVTKVTATEATLDTGVYKFGFIIGDPDLEALFAGAEPDIYQFAWVNLGARTVEDLPLVTSLDRVPEIIYVPQEGGSLDFIQKGDAEILRFDWTSKETTRKMVLFDKEKEPGRRDGYIGSFSYFSDFEPSGASGKMTTRLRGPDGLIDLQDGDFPLWSMWDEYILLRVFPTEVMERIAKGESQVDILQSLTDSGEAARFAVYDVNKQERRDISMTLSDIMALPRPIFDPVLKLVAVRDMGPADSSDTEYSIIIHDLVNDKPVAQVSGISKVNDTGVAFYRSG